MGTDGLVTRDARMAAGCRVRATPHVALQRRREFIIQTYHVKFERLRGWLHRLKSHRRGCLAVLPCRRRAQLARRNGGHGRRMLLAPQRQDHGHLPRSSRQPTVRRHAVMSLLRCTTQRAALKSVTHGCARASASKLPGRERSQADMPQVYLSGARFLAYVTIVGQIENLS
jgi:hypothetical protein